MKKKPGRKLGASSIAPEERRIGKQISMSPEEWEQIDKEAETKGITRSALIRDALKAYFQKPFML